MEPMSSLAAHIAPELVMDELEAILASETFANSVRLSRFLRHVVQETLKGNAERLKEYQLGVEVFSRGENYDPRTDPIVRVEARQLRFKLADYYVTAGRDDQIVISLPKGRYAARFDLREPHSFVPTAASTQGDIAAETLDAVEAATPPPSPKQGLRVWIWSAASIAILALTLWSFWNLRPKPPSPHQPNREARNLYLKGRYYWNKRTPEDLNRSIDCFKQALLKDPIDAQAYVGLADSYNLLSEFSTTPYREAFKRALAAARKAVELDDDSADAHSALAFASFWGAWDPATAEREFTRALQLNPNNAQTHHWYATFLVSRGHFNQALRQIEKAQELEPTSSAVLADKGYILWYGRQRDQAISLLKQVSISEPSLISSHDYLATIYLVTHDYPAYLAELNKVASLLYRPEGMALAEAARVGYAAGGQREMLKKMLAVRLQLLPLTREGNYLVAVTWYLLGDKDEAIHYLKCGVDKRETSMLLLRVDPAFRSLREDPAFVAVLATIDHSQLR